MESLQKILAEHPFTQGLDKRHLSLLTGCASNVRLEAGQRIFREGDEANQFYLVREASWPSNFSAPSAVRSPF